MVSGRYNEWRDTQTIIPIDRPDQDKPQTPATTQTEVALGGGTK